MRTRGEIESLFYEPTAIGSDRREQWRRNLELEVMLDIRDILTEMKNRPEREFVPALDREEADFSGDKAVDKIIALIWKHIHSDRDGMYADKEFREKLIDILDAWGKK